MLYKFMYFFVLVVACCLTPFTIHRVNALIFLSPLTFLTHSFISLLLPPPIPIPTGVGIISSGVRNESDAALALLTDYLDDSAVNVSTGVRTASAMGLGE